MVSQKTKDSIRSKLKEMEVNVIDENSIYDALIDTVSGEKLIRTAKEMLHNGEFNDYNHPTCVKCKNYGKNPKHSWGFCFRVGSVAVDNSWYCAGFIK